ncbi:MAG: NYN domain-containing protein [Rhodocyclaceae bacterium]|nr:MAG: NYN domain-containing protein [Rhodocyclaceae bacterium]
MKHELPAFAVLIDADNVRLDSISPILEEITRHGRVTVRRIYGDFTTSNLAGWRNKLADHAIQPIQQYRNTVGKNASDSALIIDAMDLLHSRRFEGFCLVSSDSDFTRLATRIREDGLTVFGFGEKKAPKAFVSACDRYIYVENLTASPPNGCDEEAATPVVLEVRTPDLVENSPADAEVLPIEATISGAEKVPSEPAINAESPKVNFRPASLAMHALLRAYTNVADEQGWAMLGQLSSYIHANHPDFDPRSYGCTKFIELLQKTEAFDVELRSHKNGQVYFCRPKNFIPPKMQSMAGKPVKASAYSEALLKAVTEATSANGWAPVSTIGQKLKTLGRTVKESGRSTLTDALKATGLFEMQGVGAARYFRVKRNGK